MSLFLNNLNNHHYFTNYSTYSRTVSTKDHPNSKTNCLGTDHLISRGGAGIFPRNRLFFSLIFHNKLFFSKVSCNKFFIFFEKITLK